LTGGTNPISFDASTIASKSLSVWLASFHVPLLKISAPLISWSWSSLILVSLRVPGTAAGHPHIATGAAE
jgi:hypothetical protein